MPDKYNQWDMDQHEEGSFPKSNLPSDYRSTKMPVELTPKDHIIGQLDKSTKSYKMTKHPENQPERVKDRFMIDPGDHYIKDDESSPFNPTDADTKKDISPIITKDGKEYRTFSGSATIYNPDDDPVKAETMTAGYGEVDKKASIDKNDGNKSVEPPISPFQPFNRMDPFIARETDLVAYNRTHIPIADVEFRKGFRHVFITRPECYIMCDEGGLSDQAANDDDFISCYNTLPYILDILSPRYLGGEINVGVDGLNSNFNYLLSNRLTSMSVNTMEIENLNNMAKSQEGQQISFPGIMKSEMNGQLQLTFTDTKYLEVSEMIRMWMLYMYKRHRGIFCPPYHGYGRVNNFGGRSFEQNKDGEVKQVISSSMDNPAYLTYHALDRAVEFPCTIFDIITNESDTRVIYFCEYIGAYPIQLSRTLNTQANQPITKLDVSVNFAYQAKIENNMKSLIHFNYNAGIVDHMGRLKTTAQESIPFLLQRDGDQEEGVNKMLGNYIGAAGMFTGSPYIVLGESSKDPTKTNRSLYSPYLKFAPITRNDAINFAANLGIVHTAYQTTGDEASLNQ